MDTASTALITGCNDMQHRCVACNAKYFYVRIRDVKGTGESEESASISVEKAARKAIWFNVETYPCPNCGVVQPDMIARVQKLRFNIAAIVGTVGIVVAIIAVTIEATTLVTSSWIGVAAVVVTLVVAFWGAFYDPNRDLAANRTKSEQSVPATLVQLDEIPVYGPRAAVDALRASRALLIAGLGLVVAALVAAAAAPALLVLNGWNTNTDCYPEVVGPGDTVRIYLSTKVSSIKGMYNAGGHVNATEIDVPNPRQFMFDAVSKRDYWGNRITGFFVRNKNTTLYADINIPTDPELIDRKLKLDVQLFGSYPHLYAGGLEQRGLIRHDSTELKLSSPGAGETFKAAWLGGQTSAVMLICVAWLLWLTASMALARRAQTTFIAAAGP